MMTPRDIRQGEVITADWLNAVKNAGGGGVVAGPGSIVNTAGRKAVVGTSRDIAPRVYPQYWYYAKVTASSSSTPDITLAEVDSAGDVITGGRNPDDAQAPNGREGIPVNTYGIAFEFPPTTAGGDVVTKFVPWDGLTSDPFDLRANSDDISAAEDEARTETWDINAQATGRNGVRFNPARAHAEYNNFSVFTNEVIHDASGDLLYVGPETQYQIVGDDVLQSLTGHIQIGPYDGGGENSLKVMLGPPLETTHWFRKVVFYPGTGIEISETSGGSAESNIEFPLNFDESGRNNDGVEDYTQNVYIRATGGGGSADGQGYEDVEVNGVSVLAITDGGVINVVDKASPTAGHAAVEWAGTNNTPEVTLEAEVDIDAYLKSLGSYDAGKVQVLVNNSGTIQWRDTAECP